MANVILIACSKQKEAAPRPARQLYKSQLFTKSLAYAEQRGADTIYILSAKHGLLGPNQVIAPYDETLSRQPRAERRRWAQRVLGQLKRVAAFQLTTS